MPPPGTDQSFVPRPRLTQIIDARLPSGLVRIQGPAGAGKSALVLSWAQGADVRWLGASEHHRLLSEVLHFHGLDPASDAVSLQQLAAGRPGRPAVVVIDDAHLMTVAHQDLLVVLLTTAPAALHVVLLERRPLTLAGLPARFATEPSTVSGRELSFRDGEARELVRHLAPALVQDEVDEVVTVGAGWAAALAMGARARLDHRRMSPVPWSADAPTLQTDATQLVDEAMGTLPVGTRDLLVALCDETVFDDRTAQVLSGDAEAVSRLRDLVHDGVLVQPAPGGGWFLHPVLRHSLRARTRSADRDHDTFVAAHRRAAIAQQGGAGSPQDLVRHARLAEDPLLLRDTLLTHSSRVLGPLAASQTRAAIEDLPPAVREGDPAIVLIRAMLARASGNHELSATLTGRADDAIRAAPGRTSELMSEPLALMRLWVARCGWDDLPTAVQRAREVLGCRHGGGAGNDASHRSGPAPAWTGWLLAELTAAQLALGDLEEAGLHLATAEHAATLLHIPRLHAACLAHRSLLEAINGAFETAAGSARESLALLRVEGMPQLPRVARAHLVMAWAAINQLDLIGAHAHLTDGEQASAAFADPVNAELALLLRARVLTEEGLVDDASRLLARERPVGGQPRFLRRLRLLAEAQTATLAGDNGALGHVVRGLADLAYDDDVELFAALEVAIAGEAADALVRLERLLAADPEPLTAAAGTAVRVALLLRSGREVEAAALLPELLARVAPQRLLQVLSMGFLAGSAFTRLLEAEAASPDGHPFAAEALTSLGRYTQLLPTVPGGRRPLRRVLPDQAGDDALALLTRRERQVLVELSKGGSYSDVAHALFVSENTIKTHLASIYRKLGVERRVDALRLARESRLL